MNKKYLYTIITFLLVIIFYFKTSITNNILYIFNQTKFEISSYITNIENAISLHFNQVEKIKKLEKETQNYKNYIAQISPILLNYQKFQKFQKIKNPKITFTQTISYARLPDLTSIYLTYDEKNLSTPRGLVYNNEAAGIVIKSIKNFSLAYLNSNPKTSYTVFIGEQKIPGILFGGDTITIKYIPKYHQIKIGDLVITSGLDKIFYEGVRVGKISKLTQKKLYQEAEVTPFYNALHPDFFYVVKK